MCKQITLKSFKLIFFLVTLFFSGRTGAHCCELESCPSGQKFPSAQQEVRGHRVSLCSKYMCDTYGYCFNRRK